MAQSYLTIALTMFARRVLLDSQSRFRGMRRAWRLMIGALSAVEAVR